MFIQTEVTPNPNSLKFLPGKNVSNSGSFEVIKKEDTDSELVRNLLSINGVAGIFLGTDFLTINKKEDMAWEDIKHIVISLINDFYATGKEFVIAQELFEGKKEEFNEIEKIDPISKEIKKLLNDEKYLDTILLEGSVKADKIASKKIKEIKELVGF